VLLLSRLIGQQVSTPEGRTVGRLADLTVRLNGDGNPHLVHRMVVRMPDGRRAVLPWDAAQQFHVGQVVIAAAPTSAAERQPTLEHDEILLKRDVLDTQVVDVAGQRLARVADVLLARTPAGGLEAVGVEVGFAGVLRRLRLGGGAIGEDIVAWSDLHLTSDRGHQVQLATPRAAVHRLGARGLAALVSRVDVDAANEILASRDPEVAAEAVRAMHPEVAERIRRRSPLHGRQFLRSRVWPHRRHLIRIRRG
jgi:sporulation protein YlmC with PRC-barrel domain